MFLFPAPPFSLPSLPVYFHQFCFSPSLSFVLILVFIHPLLDSLTFLLLMPLSFVLSLSFFSHPPHYIPYFPPSCPLFQFSISHLALPSSFSISFSPFLTWPNSSSSSLLYSLIFSPPFIFFFSTYPALNVLTIFSSTFSSCAFLLSIFQFRSSF